MNYDIEKCKCEICGSDNHTEVWNKQLRTDLGLCKSVVINDDNGDIIHGTNVCCNDCGLVFVSPRMTKGSLQRFYNEEYRNIYNSPSHLTAEMKHANTVMQILYAFAKQGDKLLDIGANTGKLVELANNHKINAVGIEHNPELKNENIINADFEEYEFDEKFDIITIMNTLEHMYSPKAVLSKIHNLLNDGGKCLISVPDLYNCNIRRPVDAYLSNAHLYNFSTNTLVKLCTACGLNPVQLMQIGEEIGDKLYLLCEKCEPFDLNVVVDKPEQIHEYLTAIQDVFDIRLELGVEKK